MYVHYYLGTYYHYFLNVSFRLLLNALYQSDHGTSLSSTFKLNNGIFMLRHMSAASLVAIRPDGISSSRYICSIIIEFRLGFSIAASRHNWKRARDHHDHSCHSTFSREGERYSRVDPSRA